MHELTKWNNFNNFWEFTKQVPQKSKNDTNGPFKFLNINKYYFWSLCYVYLAGLVLKDSLEYWQYWSLKKTEITT